MSLPLAGKRVLVTRPAGQVGEFATTLSQFGAEVLVAPSVEVEPMADTSEIDAALRAVSDYDWIVLTSVNGVAAFCERADALGVPLEQARFAVIGPATAKALEENGLKASAMPEEFVSEKIATAVEEVAGKRFLLARADLARADLARILREGGAFVDEITLYRLRRLSSDAIQALRSGPPPDFITLTSAEIARSTISLLSESGLANWLESSEIVCIGPITAQAVRQAGYEPAAVADEFTIPGLIHALCDRAAREANHV